MELVMYLENQLIETVPLEKGFLPTPGYVRHFVRMLRKRHKLLIEQTSSEPEFLVRSMALNDRRRNLQEDCF
jgi:hypothetical protein